MDSNKTSVATVCTIWKLKFTLGSAVDDALAKQHTTLPKDQQDALSGIMLTSMSFCILGAAYFYKFMRSHSKWGLRISTLLFLPGFALSLAFLILFVVTYRQSAWWFIMAGAYNSLYSLGYLACLLWLHRKAAGVKSVGLREAIQSDRQVW